MLSVIFTQSDIPLDHNEGPERAAVQRRPREGYSHGTSERDQIRHRGIPHALRAAVQVEPPVTQLSFMYYGQFYTFRKIVIMTL